VQFGWPTGLTWYKLFFDWQTLIAGVIAIIAALIAYAGSLKQVAESRRVSRDRAQVYAAMASLEAQRIGAAAEEQIQTFDQSSDEHLEVRYTLSRINVLNILSAEWEQLGSMQPETAFAVYQLIDAVDQFNSTIAPREELYKGAARSLLHQIAAKAKSASTHLTDELEKK
jgi:hypothetical protein